jgi:ketosteroid isomerase-like protein
MASANVELVRSIVADWERGDFSASDWMDPEIEYTIVGGLESGRSEGLASATRRWGDWLSAWEDVRLDTEECRELDDDRVLVLCTVSGRGRASGAELSQTYAKGAVLFHIRGGEVIRLVQYWDRERAFADLENPSSP